MIYTGIDIVAVDRIRRAVERWGDRFIQRIFSTAETALCHGRTESLAARWAAKEAVAKLLGVGLRGIGGAGGVAFHDIEALADAHGRPMVILRGAAQARARELGIDSIRLSLSHDHGLAIAIAIALSSPTPRRRMPW
ncbi:holo-ACP synthase [Roseiflexus castenholzii]|uniref:Holo-[acyl-carrier-protein] synthase n=1 Tax=Roseiflexus castenholzii (strain DSM 13941 / HLO8) TaxID=383372 RepID=ACPS_ROSCS|nr:holo-ACP synthase [Roseiflexus castenholzii]A7NPN5.1 RecName: Full=Holo-[acyl-carrier-protein] synthase; Short=Holo-ACP synthase; AltName: Full=4'-phosphopantetheinyl transferase AcpS [Roseiflexus castenholzii DSM 13941]ABU59531.1 holo-acyl-carrier-protein synthase [Roseiflexus castenholzii DSM 13941]